MPTGFTSAVADGKVTTLREFALSCARGMGALIMMRDEPWDAPIPERFEPSTTFYDERIAAAEALLAELPTLTDDECQARARAERQDKIDTAAKYAAEREQTRERYERMIATVEPWEGAPEGLKEFMLSQLRESVAFDCGGYERPDPPVETGVEWRRRVTGQTIADLARRREDRDAEVARTEGRNRWIAQLRASLAQADAPTTEAS